jgi:hypothetical protein
VRGKSVPLFSVEGNPSGLGGITVLMSGFIKAPPFLLSSLHWYWGSLKFKIRQDRRIFGSSNLQDALHNNHYFVGFLNGAGLFFSRLQQSFPPLPDLQ